jgi:type II secretory pathway component PulJ
MTITHFFLSFLRRQESLRSSSDALAPRPKTAKPEIPAFAGMTAEREAQEMPTASARRRQRGFSFLELMLSVFAGSVMLGGAYYSYHILSRQYDAVRSAGELHNAGHAVLSLIAADLRRAGRIAYDGDANSALGAIDAPVTITESDGDVCCDTLRVVFDRAVGERMRVTYYPLERRFPDTRQALYSDTELLENGEWQTLYSRMFVADYVDRFDVVVRETNDSGQPLFVDLETTLRAQKQGLFSLNFVTPAYSASGHADDVTDRYARKHFRRSVLLRNLERF